MKMTENNTIVAIVSVSGLNEIGKEEAIEVMGEVTGGKVEIGEERRLESSDRDQSGLPVREEQMEFRLNFFKVVK